jgi:hypothetical protein
MTDGLERQGERWTEAENIRLTAAGDKSGDFSAIGVQMKRSRWACKVQYLALKRGQGRGAASVSNQRIARQSATALAKEIRDTSPQHRSITAQFFGDPLPGRSALDQRAGQGNGVRSVSLATGAPR